MPRFREWPINLNDLCFMFFMGFVLKAIGNLSSLLRLRLKQHSGYSRTSGSISHQMQRKRRRRPHLPCAGAKPEEVHFCWSDCCNTWWNQIHTLHQSFPYSYWMTVLVYLTILSNHDSTAIEQKPTTRRQGYKDTYAWIECVLEDTQSWQMVVRS